MQIDSLSKRLTAWEEIESDDFIMNPVNMAHQLLIYIPRQYIYFSLAAVSGCTKVCSRGFPIDYKLSRQVYRSH